MKTRAMQLACAVFQGANALKGPPIVMSHGMFGNQRNLEPIAKRLSEQGRKVITADMRNHGESPHNSRMDYFAMSEDLGELLKSHDAQGGVVLGHSMGGKAAMVLALTQPEMVSKLIVEDVAPTSHSSSIGPVFRPLLATMETMDFSNATTLSEARAIAREKMFHVIPEKSICDFLVTNVVSMNNSFSWRINVDAMKNHLEDLIGFPSMEGSYSGKTLFIKGANSDLISEAYEPEIKRLFPNSRIETVVGAGHMVHAEKPQEFVDLVSKFLDEA